MVCIKQNISHIISLECHTRHKYFSLKKLIYDFIDTLKYNKTELKQ